jgi:hypothetical protein
MFILMNLKIEAKPKGSIVLKSISKGSEHIKELNNRSEAKVVNIKL